MLNNIKVHNLRKKNMSKNRKNTKMSNCDAKNMSKTTKIK